MPGMIRSPPPPPPPHPHPPPHPPPPPHPHSGEDLGSLGWRGHFQADDEEVAALRCTLDATAGLKGLELVDSRGGGDFAERAAALFRRDGYVLVRDALSPVAVNTVRAGCDILASAGTGTARS